MAQIVLLEDDQDLAKQIMMGLNLDGHDVTVFDEVAPALRFFEANEVDLVIADLFIRQNGQIAKEGGLTLMSGIRQQLKASVPIIAISGSFNSFSQNEMKQSAKTVGATYLLAKPFHPDALSRMIEHLLL